MALSYRAAQTLIKRGDEPALRAALDAGLNANLSNQNGWSLLMLCAVEGVVPIGLLLVDRGAEINARNRAGETALSLAAHKGHIPFLQLLLEYGASTEGQPHGATLKKWLTTASGLQENKLAEVLRVLGFEKPA